MGQASMQDQIDAAEAYEDLMVAALFGEWTVRVADAARIQRGDRVLDLACGTGILARDATARVGDEGSVAGLDPAAGMLEVAKRLAPKVTWHQGIAEDLPFEDDSFDAVVSQFGIMFFQDRNRALQESMRVLAPGGRLVVAAWDAIEKNPGYADEVGLVERIAGRPAADGIRLPFSLGDRRAIQSLFDDAGVSNVSATTEAGTARFPSVRIMVEADLRGWLPVLGINLKEATIRAILQEAKQSLAQYVTETGEASFATSVHVVSGAKDARSV